MQIYTIDELDDGSKNSVAKVSNMRINNVLIVCGNRSFTSTTRLTASQLTEGMIVLAAYNGINRGVMILKINGFTDDTSQY